MGQGSGPSQGFPAGPPPRDSQGLHQRQSSGGFEPVTPTLSTQPIGKPTPIGRPASVVHGQRPAPALPHSNNMFGVSEVENNHLGSSALLPDSEEATQEFPHTARRNASVPGPGGMPYSTPNLYGGLDSVFNSPWGPQAGQSNFFGSAHPPPGFAPPGFPSPPQPVPWIPAFGAPTGAGRQTQPRSVAIRQLLCQACKDLAESPDTAAEDKLDGVYVSMGAVAARVNSQNQNGEPVSEKELEDICDTIGNSANGGGSFDCRSGADDRLFVRWIPDGSGAQQPHLQRAVGALGEIGSPVVGAGPFAVCGRGSSH